MAATFPIRSLVPVSGWESSLPIGPAHRHLDAGLPGGLGRGEHRSASDSVMKPESMSSSTGMNADRAVVAQDARGLASPSRAG